MKNKKVMIATGGTGGHVYPAIALAQQLKVEVPGCEILFVGGGLSTNKYFDRTAFAHSTVPCGAFTSLAPIKLMSSLGNIAKGVWESRSIIKRFQPNVAVGFGSFYAFPPLLAAKLMSVPVVLHEANSIPGKVNRVLSKWAEVTGVHFPETVPLLKGKAVEVGLPLRQGFKAAAISSEEARKHFGLDPHKTTLLVFGGSQGARAINLMVQEAMRELGCGQQIQVLHISGDVETARELTASYRADKIVAVVKPFEDHMELAWQAADVVICRAGAGAVAEQLEFEVPGILIPYPRAAENHQEHNADFMVNTVGGAVKLLEHGLTAERLVNCLQDFLKDGGVLLKEKRQAMGSYKKKSRTKDLCALVKELL